MHPNNLLYMPGAEHRIPKIVVIKLHDLWETPQVILTLREGKIVILILKDLEFYQVQRAVDLINGASCAINGYAKWIGEETFLFVPEGVDVNVSKYLDKSK